MTKNYEPAIIKHFWNGVTEEQVNNMSDEEVLQRIDAYLEKYIASWQKRNKGKDLPTIPSATIAMVRNKKMEK